MGKVTYKQTSKKMKSRNVYSIGQSISKRYIYRYVALDVFMECIRSGNVRFSEPSEWKDKFEKRFYEADYQTNLKAPANTHPRLYAFCSTIQKESEPGWKMYTDNQPMVEIKINRLKWLDVLSEIAKSEGIAFYEGVVNYDIKTPHIQILHQPTYQRIVKGTAKAYPVKGHDELFDSFNLDSFLSLLLIKRDAFGYEKEIRYFAIPKSQQQINQNHLFLSNIPWADIIEEIKVSDTIQYGDFQNLKIFLKQHGISPDILSPFDIRKDYWNPDRIIIER